MDLLTDTYADKISGVLHCYDRIVITGTLPQLCYAQGMSSYLYYHNIRIFDYPNFAEPYRDRIRENAEHLARQEGIAIEFIRKSHIRKEDLVKKAVAKRGTHPGLVAILSAMESCPSYRPWHDKATGKTFLKGTQSKCLHYYFYLIDPQLGLCYVRVPTWCPFKLQVYFNGHGWLASRLDQAGIAYTMLDNAFDSIADWDSAQAFAGELDIDALHERLDEFAGRFCPVYTDFEQCYHWSLMQCEYASDIVFKKQSDLQGIYQQLMATAIHTVHPENIATFLGQKLAPQYQGEIGNLYHVRLEGSRIKHHMGANAIKMYDKFSKILRIETTTNKVSFFKHYRKVEHRDGTSSHQLAGVKKSIYSLPPLADILQGCNRRYLEFISGFDTKVMGRKRLEKISQPKTKHDRTYKGFNLFGKEDLRLLMLLLRGEFTISGFQNKHIREGLPELSSAKVSRILKRLHVHGLVKKVQNTYKYYLTKLGKQVLISAEKVKHTIIIPTLNY